ncbi:3-isopropylmalate dehydratase small subunit [Hyphomonas pacifica]|uniref:3-isopropylmalate dehydratase small subunit n=1 Tax=Hyphomonas pacifica TaxID=1280941 RepID=A0A062TUR0_9PROT|nr:3-isopropylmalate dehydratase small subunit [Hyphomonas pacifica]MAN47290.1 3-isopropylmalate dehydratase small subunit [Hyphomonas sp.]MBR9808201.1 3-isopropylmalate dehydratase small subunit [Alphaproteobacteria bacterium]KCZ46196.1 isopropylmalate isomerase [Hyphomonas pacifica]RAN31527.1 isopropylmalate isomerase [Hyphomonas pacifica]RAN35798.1 isopropylmalate isomerase [Hyphomonas pacifica]|tara:strand:- start:20074 stop:20703 length:630 start_codon:yes stop_codon:yes gene_type:complete
MKAFTQLTGTAAPLLEKGKPMSNVDTDMIIPKQFLKTTERTGLSKGLFHELKTLSDGSPNPQFVLNRPEYATASILIAGKNFGCGSSREHAPWALLDQGITCVIAPSFADIFHNNCYKNGILPVCLPEDVCQKLAEQAGGSNHVFTVDLEAQTVTGPDGESHGFEVDEGRKANLMAGLDEIGASLTASARIDAFEAERKLTKPWLEPAR